MKILNGNLEAVAQSLGDLGANRLPYPVAVRLHNVGKAVRGAISDREALRLELVKPYLPEGKQEVTPEDPGFAELVAKIGELFSTNIDVNTGEPIDLSKLGAAGDNVTLRPGTLELLDQYGLLAGMPQIEAAVPAPPPALALVSDEPQAEKTA